ncbi:hypothetical protein [Aureibacter tunicatorum]|uniref:D-lyxose ketol-isomerase n=1 Tax=Aureibacter tunicatorum TaxID=866807 RepID=A0AAE3XTV8_9BACT|nr:hypothetical protein [Aureibacter tunicatorum]MDR6241786.1 hypothetical protein [Aureibacter tunicatorum]BDD07422.1 hypothetical protein AUTU_49050 [Aureibacter tunicatorum]
MERRSAIKQAMAGIAGLALGATACAPENKKDDKNINAPQVMKSLKKYTNDDFYVNGKLSGEKTLKAYMDMLEFYNYPVDDFLRKNLFISDFSHGDFVNAGMAGVFWHNSDVFKYFAHEIFLLPGQMIIEHKHVETSFAAKMETWHVRHGSVYCFGEGEETAGNPSTPESQQDFITVNNAKLINRGELNTLNRPEAPHFMMAGEHGAIVSEYANFHDNDGLVFTNTNAVFNNVI